jgi:2-iminobutanoate/2-iminopropanoate deaminase
VRRPIPSGPGVPAPLGPYSPAVVVDDLVFTAGQIGIDPATGTLVAGGVLAEVDQALANLEATLRAAGCSLADVVKTTIFLTDLTVGPQVNAAYAARLCAPFPARSTVGVAALPAGATVEIEAIAVRRGGTAGA